MRKDLRHPVEVPIHICACQNQPRMRLDNFSYGGLCCISPTALPLGAQVEIDIPDIQPPSYHGLGVVAWCRHAIDHFEVGIQFASESAAFASRMAEQVCEIEVYRRKILRRYGRTLSTEEAAQEWIGKYARRYPRSCVS
jgi:hypothetical protein